MVSTSYNQTSSSSTSTSPPTLWDVFLSFRGKDTRYTFTDHLYKALHRTGIRTFKDDPELRSGEVISDSLIQAIQESKTYIIVLSENYASSSWCLDELVEILCCYKTMKRLVVPVFYYIDPSVVRHQIGSFKEAFEKHQTRIEVEKVNTWRITLNEVAGFSGYHVSQNRSQADIVDEVVERVLLKINPVTLNVAKYPVGLDSRVEGVTTLFDSDVEAVIKIGIHGMGGVGKTTLAKAVYNQNYQRFDGSCFLANVREASRAEKGIVCLQQQLIADVLKCKNIDGGIELIRDRLCSIKVLIVIDDLDNPKPLKYLEGSFALGSVVIITTRNEDLLDRIEVKAKYKVKQMDKEESHQLFTRHAFGEDKMPHTFTKLSEEILIHAGGLPLALQVFGSTLLNESEDGWEWFIDKLKRAPIDDVEENLMISFDALKSVDPTLQDIFLDIACFYIGSKKEKVAEIMETCYMFVNRKIDILQKRCLITINKFGILGMHDLLRDLGRNIARNNSTDEPGNHSRLWVSEDIDTILENHKGTEAIQGIIRGYHCQFQMEGVTFIAESFKRMSKLKFLCLNNVNLTGSFKQTFKDLRWLCWKFFPLECFPSDFYAEKLVILELPQSNMRTWEPPREFKKLKSLNMSGSRKLETTPDFTRFPCLETLNLKDCSSLEQVHVSIGSLGSLVHLNLGNCSNLRSLPDNICSLRALEVLNIDDCRNLLSISGLPTSLQQIKAKDCRSLKKLPDLSNLKHLKELDLKDCSCLTEIQGLEELKSLRDLDLQRCSSMEGLPNLSNLKHLKRMNLKYCASLTKVIGLGKHTCLEDFDLSYCDNLVSVSCPPNLKLVYAKDRTSLKRFPNLSNFKQLGRLDLAKCAALKEIQGLEELTSLVNLVFRCGNLLSVSKLPTNLQWIKAEDCWSLKRLPDLSSLKHLKKLELNNCEALKEIQGLEEVTSLEYLSLSNCRSMERLPNLCKSKHLKRLGLTDCDGLKVITGLEYLEFGYCGKSVSKLPPILKWVDAHGCSSLKRLPNRSNWKQLEIFETVGDIHPY